MNTGPSGRKLDDVTLPATTVSVEIRSGRDSAACEAAAGR